MCVRNERFGDVHADPFHGDFFHGAINEELVNSFLDGQLQIAVFLGEGDTDLVGLLPFAGRYVANVGVFAAFQKFYRTEAVNSERVDAAVVKVNSDLWEGLVEVRFSPSTKPAAWRSFAAVEPSWVPMTLSL